MMNRTRIVESTIIFIQVHELDMKVELVNGSYSRFVLETDRFLSSFVPEEPFLHSASQECFPLLFVTFNGSEMFWLALYF